METAENYIGIPDEDDAYRYKIRMNISRLKDEMNNLPDIEKEIISRSSHNEDINNFTNLRGLGIINSAIIVWEIFHVPGTSCILFQICNERHITYNVHIQERFPEDRGGKGLFNEA